MNTRDNAESIVQDLHDMACDGDVAEVMVFVRDASGRLLCAYASDDMQRFIDDVRAALADAEANPSQRRTLQ
ncbi:hypothetical protein [Caldimonas thermodepolymerans]|jgi:hypothetical protein|uniref:hypothetical protein n=1 Tax=Caldimonas thermodepolymerans TaxID=215580 RepID=UPI002493BA8B|nr:hypothetical protein [Caldimonas thermodepolymerans]